MSSDSEIEIVEARPCRRERSPSPEIQEVTRATPGGEHYPLERVYVPPRDDKPFSFKKGFVGSLIIDGRPEATAYANDIYEGPGQGRQFVLWPDASGQRDYRVKEAGGVSVAYRDRDDSAEWTGRAYIVLGCVNKTTVLEFFGVMKALEIAYRRYADMAGDSFGTRSERGATVLPKVVIFTVLQFVHHDPRQKL